MKTLQYIRLHKKNSTTQISHYNTFHFLRYVHFSYAKYLFGNIQKQQNTLKSSLLLRKIQTLRVNNSRILRIQNTKFSRYFFYMNISGSFQICISVPLTELQRNVFLRVINSAILKICNTKFSGYCFYMNTKISDDFQICINAPLTESMHEKCPCSEFFWPVFSRIWTEFGDLLLIFFFLILETHIV